MLTEIEERSAALKEKSRELFDQKTQEILDDASYNIEVSAIGQQLDTCNQRKRLVLERLDKVSSNLARSALR